MANAVVASPFLFVDTYPLSPSPVAPPITATSTRPHYYRQSELLSRPKTAPVNRKPSLSVLPKGFVPPTLSYALSFANKSGMGVKDVIRGHIHSDSKSLSGTSSPRGPLTTVHNVAVQRRPQILRKTKEIAKKAPAPIDPQKSVASASSVQAPCEVPKGKSHAPDLPCLDISPLSSASSLSLKQSNNVEGTSEKKCYFSTEHDMINHPATAEDVAYVQANDPVILASDSATNDLLRTINPTGTPSFSIHDGNVPQRVLDLGCGEGHWVRQAALAWKGSGTRIVGFDLVSFWDKPANDGGDVRPQNLTWIQGNFVKYPLPFPDQSFDFVRMANLTLCIPGDRWLFVLGEVRRVLTTGGRLELIDDEMYFPYEKCPPHNPLTPSSSTPLSTISSLLDIDVDDEFYDGDTSSSRDFRRGSLSARFSADWEAQVESCRALEQVFTSMLEREYNILPGPRAAIPSLLECIFGSGNWKKTCSRHVGLAPRRYNTPAWHDELDHSSVMHSTNSIATRKSSLSKDGRSWLTVEWDKPGKSKDDFLLTRSSVPGTISAKAAGRLGLQPVHRSAFSQSPGLIVWPSTFLAMEPLLVELHACKYVHTLLGYRDALARFLAGRTDENGARLMSDEEINRTLWDYECFRRKRFSWPEDAPTLRMERSHEMLLQKPATTRTHSTDLPLSHPYPGSSRNPSKPSVNSDARATPVRSFRVYVAYREHV